MYWLLMEKLDPGYPGSANADKPLHRLADTAKQRANRGIICDNTFIPRSETPDVSCDEYPFAASRESGGASLTTGKQCVQLYAAPSGSAWKLEYDNNYPLPNWAAPCGRGSIPLDQNRGAGGGVGGLVSKVRLLDDDPYYVGTPGFENCNPNTSCVVTP
jgi:hypothetical protein